VVEVVVGHQATIGFATELSVFFFVDALEDGTLVPRDALVATQRAAHLVLGHVHETDLELLVRLRVVDQVVHAAPRRLDLLELVLVEHEVDLLRQLAVDLGNDGFDAAVGVVRHGRGIDERLLGERANGRFDGLARLVGLGLELLVQEGGEVGGVGVLRRLWCVAHWVAGGVHLRVLAKGFRRSGRRWVQRCRSRRVAWVPAQATS
jgi:hypothetical protein